MLYTMSAKELSISQEQLDALILVYHLLDKKLLVHIKDEPWSRDKFENQYSNARFNMCHWHGQAWDSEVRKECGTVMCIGGAAEAFGNVDFHFGMPTELDKLFYPDVKIDMNEITPDQAKQALYNYLTMGHPEWDEVLKGSV
jgi:hypothetical protein